jgi:hypothetical protein
MKRDAEYWNNINWTDFEQIELDFQDGELIDVYERVGDNK